ncbi:hypothetical protein GUITHDRAFT_151627, partial [Guillardia theta CCMP2712]|uniref:Uncharacterized protein n=2 Tax=Guillardia theta TaxID=55529 RepID=A0A7S4P9T6_GUITH|mmetsp:Transcript_46411/g.145592  ORF Transcript_46411/g.145592 Transcript_46411/m.145592 type:complete len:324 (+) Transcript_46411:32-1003(+)
MGWKTSSSLVLAVYAGVLLFISQRDKRASFDQPEAVNRNGRISLLSLQGQQQGYNDLKLLTDARDSQRQDEQAAKERRMALLKKAGVTGRGREQKDGVDLGLLKQAVKEQNYESSAQTKGFTRDLLAASRAQASKEQKGMQFKGNVPIQQELRKILGDQFVSGSYHKASIGSSPAQDQQTSISLSGPARKAPQFLSLKDEKKLVSELTSGSQDSAIKSIENAARVPHARRNGLALDDEKNLVGYLDSSAADDHHYRSLLHRLHQRRHLMHQRRHALESPADEHTGKHHMKSYMNYWKWARGKRLKKELSGVVDNVLKDLQHRK